MKRFYLLSVVPSSWDLRFDKYSIHDEEICFLDNKVFQQNPGKPCYQGEFTRGNGREPWGTLGALGNPDTIARRDGREPVGNPGRLGEP